MFVQHNNSSSSSMMMIILIAASSLLVSIVFLWRHFMSKLELLQTHHHSSLHGKHVVITGGSSGIGYALARVCLSQGAFVTLIARNPFKLSQASRNLMASLHLPPSRILLKTVDVADAESVAQAIRECFQWRAIDILISNAAVSVNGFIGDVPPEDLTAVAKTNILGCMFPIHAALPLLKDRSKRGHPVSIVLMGSVSGMFMIPGSNMYTVSKYAVRGIAELLRLELQAYNIKISLVCPGYTETPLLDQAEKLAEMMPSMRKVTLYDRRKAQAAEEVAEKAMEGVMKGEFLVTTSMDGYLLGCLCRGLPPADTCSRAIAELLLLIPLRILSFPWHLYARSTFASSSSSSNTF